jgi:hypothetical protein
VRLASRDNFLVKISNSLLATASMCVIQRAGIVLDRCAAIRSLQHDSVR